MAIEYDRVQTRSEIEETFWLLDAIIKERESETGTGPIHQKHPTTFLMPIADLYEIDLRIMLEHRCLSKRAKAHGREMMDAWWDRRVRNTLVRTALAQYAA